jgi:hypothetical protein
MQTAFLNLILPKAGHLYPYSMQGYDGKKSPKLKGVRKKNHRDYINIPDPACYLSCLSCDQQAF